MTQAQKIELRRSEIRQRLGELSKTEGELTDEQRSEVSSLEAELTDSEVKLRAALQSNPEEAEERETEGDAEERERRELRSKAKLGDWLAAAFERRRPDGASAEYSEACGMSADKVPLALFGDPVRPIETRAVTPSPDPSPEQSPRPTVPAIFERAIAARLMVQFPMVPAGQSNTPVLSNPPPAGAVAKGTAADATAGAFRLETRKPGRIAGVFEIAEEDVALMPSLESDLRMALSAAMTNALDEQVIAGDGTGANLSGLLKVAADVNVAGDVVTFASGIALLAALVDGLHAYGYSDLRTVIGSATFAKMAATHATNDDSAFLWDYLAGKLGALVVSNRVPAVANNGQRGLVVLTGGGQPVQVPVWSGLTLLADPYTQASEGQRRVVATLLAGSPVVPYGVAQVKEIHPKLSE